MPEIVRAQLVICPHCEKPVVVIDGKPQGPVTLWMKNGVPTMTAHHSGCGYAGREIPESEFI
jgi:hypothetical protein